MSVRGKLKQIVNAALVRRQQPIVLGDLKRFDPISPEFGWRRGTPIDRYYIQSYINDKSSLIRGECLEIAEPKYLSQFRDRIARTCILAPYSISDTSGIDQAIIGDLASTATLPQSAFDCFICTQTLQFIYQIKEAIVGAHHLLKEGGMLIGTVPGISQISRYDMDNWGEYWRLTSLSATRMLSEVFGDDVEVASFGNALAAQLLLQGVAVEDLPDRSVLDVKDPDYEVIVGFCARKARA
jgi:hypothetical protein